MSCLSNSGRLQVSIIIVNFNYAQFLGCAIDSALAVGNLAETIVVDDGSTDHSAQLIEGYGDRIRPIFQSNSGACAARNAGLQIARAPYVKFLDADDWLVEGATAKQVEHAAQIGDRKACVFGDVIWTTPQGRPYERQNSVDPRDETYDLTKIVRYAPLTSAPLHRRIDLEAVGGFDPAVRRGQEHDLHVRLSLSGVSFHYRPGPTYFYRQHENGARISASDGSVGESVLAASKRHVTLAREAGLMTPDLAQAFAHRLWRQGRETLQRGARATAQRFFNEARSIYPDEPTGGRQSYRVLNKMVGPVTAERISRGLSRLRQASLRP